MNGQLTMHSPSRFDDGPGIGLVWTHAIDFADGEIEFDVRGRDPTRCRRSTSRREAGGRTAALASGWATIRRATSSTSSLGKPAAGRLAHDVRRTGGGAASGEQGIE